MAEETRWRNRIVGSGTKPADQFTHHPNNPKYHPPEQREALKGALNEIGWIAPVVENIRTGYVIDGHERLWNALERNEDVPYVQVDLDPREEAYALATLDPIGMMARHDAAKLDELLREVNSGEAGVQAMLSKLAISSGLVPTDNPYDEWVGMPEFEQEDLTSFRSIHVHFKCQEDVDKFASLIGQKIGEKTRSIWYPEAEKIDMYSELYVHEP